MQALYTSSRFSRRTVTTTLPIVSVSIVASASVQAIWKSMPPTSAANLPMRHDLTGVGRRLTPANGGENGYLLTDLVQGDGFGHPREGFQRKLLLGLDRRVYGHGYPRSENSLR